MGPEYYPRQYIGHSRYGEVKNRFEIGLASTTDMFDMDAFVLEVKYCTGTINTITFCNDGLVAAKKMLEAVQMGYEVGIRSITDFTNSRVKIAEIEKMCEEKMKEQNI